MMDIAAVPEETRPLPRPADRTFAIWLLAVTLLGGGLRLYHLERASFWIDELKTVKSIALLADMYRSKQFGYVATAAGLWACGVDPRTIPAEQPELWRGMGVTEWSARIASCVIGILSIPILGWAARPLLGRHAAFVLPLLLAVAPWHIYWSQAARFYTQQFLFYNLALIAYFIGTRDGSTRQVGLAMLMAVLAFLTQPPALVLFAVLGTDWAVSTLLRKRPDLSVMRWVLLFAAAGLCLFIMKQDVSTGPSGFAAFMNTQYQTPAKMVVGTIYMVGLPVVVFAGAAAWALIGQRSRMGVFFLAAAVVPMVFFGALSMNNYVGLRYAFVSLFGWLVLAAVGSECIVRATRSWWGSGLGLAPAGMLVASMMLANYSYYTAGAGLHTRWKDAFAYVREHRTAAEPIYSIPIIAAYYLEQPGVRPLPKSAGQVTASAPAWIVYEAEDAIRGRTSHHWLSQVADYRASFDLRVVQPFSSVAVYYCHPAYPPRRPPLLATVSERPPLP